MSTRMSHGPDGKIIFETIVNTLEDLARFERQRMALIEADARRAALRNEALKLSMRLACDACGQPTGAYVYENDIEGSYFFCQTCKDKP